MMLDFRWDRATFNPTYYFDEKLFGIGYQESTLRW
jgi:hypothetical protein